MYLQNEESWAYTVAVTANNNVILRGFSDDARCLASSWAHCRIRIQTLLFDMPLNAINADYMPKYLISALMWYKWSFCRWQCK